MVSRLHLVWRWGLAVWIRATSAPVPGFSRSVSGLLEAVPVQFQRQIIVAKLIGYNCPLLQMLQMNR